jgi:hypothetical protein
MQCISLNEPELGYLNLFRAALSEENFELRERAIKNVKHDVVSDRLDRLFKEIGSQGLAAPENAEFMQWAAMSTSQRNEAAYAFSDTSRRYEDKNEQRLNVAEEIGFTIFSSIKDGKFKGVHTRGGIFEQMREQAELEEVRGAKDKDVLRQCWNTYKGVVHFGMALTYCEENLDQHFDIFDVAKFFREILSQNCPKGTRKPYVDPDIQISFVYLSKLWGPRFGNRGLPYDVV